VTRVAHRHGRAAQIGESQPKRLNDFNQILDQALVTRKAHVGAVEETLTRRPSLTGNF
jgi:hypothetical protein